MFLSALLSAGMLPGVSDMRQKSAVRANPAAIS
jgi:hypothetical protein